MADQSLRPYQIEDVNFLCENNAVGCFNEQRTGKTPTALMCIKKRGLENSRVLIVTTASTVYQWADEYETWLGKPCVACCGTPTQKSNIINEQWTNGLVISLHSLKETANRQGYLDAVLKLKPSMIILDEAHQIRHCSTWAAKTAFKLSKIPIRMALTGTPAYGEPKDIFAILKFLFPQTFTSEYKFYQYYMKPTELCFYVSGRLVRKIEYKSFYPQRQIELQNFLNRYCTQRKRKDIMEWLPEKDKQIIKLPLTKQQNKYLQELKDTYATENIETIGVLDRLIRYRQIALDPMLLDLKSESPKTQWILDFIEDNPDTPILIFSNFTSYLTRLFEILQKHKVKEAMIVGSVDAKTRNKFKNDFQDGKFNVFLINTMSGKEGLTLDRAEAIIFTDLYPPVGAIEQAEDRFVATTIEKKDKPHVIYNLIMKDSFDEVILDGLKQRKTETEIINDFKSQLNKKEVKHNE